MTHLSLEECKRLAEAGMPQELSRGDWVWLDGSTPEKVLVTSDNMRWVEYQAVYKIPSLKTIMEFAKTLDRVWYITPCDNGWRVMRYNWDDGSVVQDLKYVDPNPIEAVYQLIDKVAP